MQRSKMEKEKKNVELEVRVQHLENIVYELCQEMGLFLIGLSEKLEE